MKASWGVLFCCMGVIQLTAQCSYISTQDLLDGKFLAASLKIVPDSASVLVGDTLQFSGSGGVPPYTYAVYLGAGTIAADKYSAPASVGDAIVSITDSRQNFAFAKVTIIPGPDSILPTLISSTPADLATNVAPCSGSPCTAKISLVFSESMNTSLAQILTTEIWDSTTLLYVSAPSTNTTFAWSKTTFNNDTLTINLSWLRFPETTQIRYSLAATALQDTSANQIAAAVQRSFTTTTTRQNFAVPETGAVACQNNTAVMTCGSDVNFPGQDADYLGTPNARALVGPTAHVTYGSDLTTSDGVTGLIWKSCSEGLSGATCATGTALTMSWYAAVDQCSALNTANSGSGYAGLTVWRLPTMHELETITDLSRNIPSTVTTAFPATPTNSFYWSGSTHLGNGLAWGVSFTDGTPTSSSRTNNNYVRCVVGVPIVSTVWVNNGDGTTTDNVTNLRWQQATSTGTWSQALLYCEGLTLGTGVNQSNWRLPSLYELMSIIDRSRVSPAVDMTQFSATVSGTYWSSTGWFPNKSYTWGTSFNTGSSSNTLKTGTQNMRCVSTGP